jgi:hypothetical protein
MEPKFLPNPVSLMETIVVFIVGVMVGAGTAASIGFWDSLFIARAVGGTVAPFTVLLQSKIGLMLGTPVGVVIRGYIIYCRWIME